MDGQIPTPQGGLAKEKAGAPVCAAKVALVGELSTRYVPAVDAERSKTVFPGAMAEMLPAADCVRASGRAGGENAPV